MRRNWSKVHNQDLLLWLPPDDQVDRPDSTRGELRPLLHCTDPPEPTGKLRELVRSDLCREEMAIPAVGMADNSAAEAADRLLDGPGLGGGIANPQEDLRLFRLRPPGGSSPTFDRRLKSRFRQGLPRQGREGRSGALTWR